MTNEQLARLVELQKLYEEGILNKDDIAKEKAKILGQPVPDTQSDANMSGSQAHHPSETPQVVETGTRQPVTLKIKVSKDSDEKKTEKVIPEKKPGVVEETNQFKNVDGLPNSQTNDDIVSNDTGQAKSNTVVQKPSEPTAKNSFQRYKHWIYIAAGVLILFLVYKIAQRHKTAFSKSEDIAISEENMTNTRTYEDKFEQMWIIGSERNYTESDFKDWCLSDLRILRNYFFAKNNYSFESTDLRDYFSKYLWYQPKYKDVSVMFTDLQINNVQFIKKLEGLPNTYKSPK